MAYEKTEWKDRVVQNPRTYQVRENEDGTITLLDAPGEITEIGTPVNAANLNKMEQGIYDAQRVVGDIGDIYYTLRTDVPAGGAWCDGAEYTKAAFPDIYQMLVDGKISSTDYTTFDNSVSTNGFCDLFALNTSTTSFKVPKLLNKYVMTVDDEVPVIGNGMTVGLTNGTNEQGLYQSVNPSGGVYLSANAYGSSVGTDSTATGGISSNASVGITTDPTKSGIIADTTSSKKVATLRAYVVLYTGAVEASVAQAQEFMTALGGKANTDLSNVTPAQSFKDMSIGWGMPDYDSGISITSYTSSDNQFVAPCDGIIYWGGALKHACYLNGFKANCFSSDSATAGNNKTLILNEGNTFYATGYIDNSEINNCFFPFKGVNHNA